MSDARQLEVRYRGRIIEHLTVQTYQSPIAAIAEMVANAWDADATTVEITLPDELKDDATIVVADSGSGMTFEQVQERYLEVGFERREGDARKTSEDKSRPLMGRKGIGKFAGFGIADVMVVDTVSRDTGERTMFRLDYDRLRGKSTEYVDVEPTKIPDVEWYASGDHDAEPGTRIELKTLKLRQRPSPDVIRRSLARRFLLLELADDFAVSVNGTAISSGGDDAGVQFSFPTAWAEDSRPEGLVVDDDGWGIETIGGGHRIRWKMVFYEDTIKDEDLRGVSVFAHGKLAQRPFFFEVGERGGTQAQAGLQYLSGQVEASFLDDDDDDIISIERQRVDWEHPTAAPLREWGEQRVRTLLAAWNRARVDEKVKTLDAKVARFSPRLAKLQSRERKIVEGAIRKFAQVRALTNDQFVGLSEAVLTAWEGGRLHELINDVADADTMSEADLLNVLVEHHVLTALHTAEAVKAKRQVVYGLRGRIQKRELENAVRDFIAENPWLIDPKWETFKVEKSLKKLVDDTSKKALSDDMLDKRVDLVLASGSQVLVLEFMRPGLTLDNDHLSRFEYYVNSIRVAVEANTGGPFTTVVGYLVADRIAKDAALNKKVQSMAADNKFAIEWETLLTNAGRHWTEFFEALVERSPDDPRIQDLREVPAGTSSDGDEALDAESGSEAA